MKKILTVVLDGFGLRTDKNGNAMWKCRCSCGNEIIVQGIKLRNGNTKSCGCVRVNKLINDNQKRIKDISQQRFGLLIALEPTAERTNNKDVIWKCICDCGNVCKVSGHDLRTGNTKSCGCQRTVSFGETKIQKILKDNNISYIKEYTNNLCRYPNNNYLARFDFYLPNYQTLIEYDGKQHSISGKGNFDNPNKFKLTQEHDKFKNNWAKENGYIIIRIPYIHYDNLSIEDLLPETSTFIVK